MSNLIQTANHTIRTKDVECIERMKNPKNPEPYIILIYRYNHTEPIDVHFATAEARDESFEHITNLMFLNGDE